MGEILTIGHSTRSLEDLIGVLAAHQIKILVDIRHFPRSRHNPQFNKAALQKRLPRAGIRYVWLEALGGYRKGGYAKYTCTNTFQSGLARLEKLAAKRRAAVMCAELLWWRCHRRYVSDELKRRGWRVWHIFDEKKLEAHKIGKRRRIKCD